MAKRSDIEENSKKFLALNVETVILERMGFSTESATREPARMSLKDYDIPKILEETQTTAKIFLDAMQRSVPAKSAENVSLPENNPLLKEMGVIQIAAEPEKKSTLKEESKPIQLSLFDDIDTSSDEPKQKLEESELALIEKISKDEKSATNEETTKLENLGFQQGIILEPSMGVGGFFGNMPEEMRKGSHLYGVELDSLTGRIAILQLNFKTEKNFRWYFYMKKLF